MDTIITLYHRSDKIIKNMYMVQAFAQITFQQALLAENKKWMPQKMARDSRARQEYFSSRKEPRKQGDIYMLQILDEEMKADDPRIR